MIKVNVEQVFANLGQLRPKAEAAAARAVTQFANHVGGQAQILAPVGGGIYSPRDPQPGRLKDSMVVEPAENTNGLIISRISFNTVYAHAQHERLDFRHDQGQAKYLETAMRANASKLSGYVIGEVRRELGT